MQMRPVIFARSMQENADEFRAATLSCHFEVSKTRVGLVDRLVVARYSALPYYKELEYDLKIQGSKLVNSYHEHEYIADFGWYWDVEGLTPKTWFNLADVPKNRGAMIVKGRTNSKKLQWKSKMFAPTYEDVVRLYCDLSQDEFLGPQGLVIREFVPLKTYEIGINDLPFTNEWRFFFYKETLLSYAYYWIVSEYTGEMDEKGMDFARKVANLIAPMTNFFVLDIAQQENGEWILIEVNDGQCSGLQGNDPVVLYKNLMEAL